ncbi:short-chain dehydrogenase/reductase SDR [Fadolivirus algeromassiliense]|jgi:NAD(P)-dependent dehydrogenase (short-subunit alcohol dehydrogenase family)|uniref:Short-chain dehydrogenase/reductase SDR n=1 Tax=Fadolivirus FV1/VV64 TaxID=3070911 RepID=A0A7D3QVD5_9VIRU|nr:short-chain dehydrogenase/reductase SDR [Fadolivirus algeromassiliense]QKF94847.1 short-chain dehydrogenase/reductase SDR [Fadolivirus FV1/VV64]
MLSFIWLLLLYCKRLLVYIFTKKEQYAKPEIKQKQKVMRTKLVKQDQIYHQCSKFGGNNTITRQLNKTCHDLYEFDQIAPLNRKAYKLKDDEYFLCYGCVKPSHSTHPVYVFSCRKCGDIFQKYRYFSRDLTGLIGLVTGTRTKLGHQITLKLLRAGATMIGTTRYPNQALSFYEKYSDFNEWKDRFIVYPEPVDFDNPEMINILKQLHNFIFEKYGRLDILINCAAQTIRIREKEKPIQPNESNRYGDAKFVEEKYTNSWQMKLSDLIQPEMEEVYRVNAIAPCLMVQQMIPLLKKSQSNPYIINVHAREGLIDISCKTEHHIHLNMAKSSLAMLTRCLVDCNLKTDIGKDFCVHGSDPGWISVDEYYENSRPWIVPPLDEIDGAARILYPLFAKLGSCRKTRRHYFNLSY